MNGCSVKITSPSDISLTHWVFLGFHRLNMYALIYSMTIISVSRKSEMVLNKCNFKFLIDQKNFYSLLQASKYIEFWWCTSCPYNFFICQLNPINLINPINFTRLLKLILLSITVDYLKFYKRLEKLDHFFEISQKLCFYQIKRSVRNCQSSIKIYFVAKHENRFCEQKETFSNLFRLLFSKLQPF